MIRCISFKMLQEESCKRLAKLLHTSFSRSYFIEFASRLDMDIQPKKLRDLEKVEVSQKQRLREQTGENLNDRRVNRNPIQEDTSRKDPNGKGRDYAGNLVYLREAKQRQLSENVSTKMTVDRPITRQSSSIGSQIDLLRAISGISDIEPPSKPSEARQPAAFKQTGGFTQRPSLQQKRRQSTVRSFRDQSRQEKAGQSVGSGSKSRDLSRVNRTRKQNTKSGFTSKKSFMQDLEALYSDTAQYLSIGDTILLSFKQKVFIEEIDEFKSALEKAQRNFINEANNDAYDPAKAQAQRENQQTQNLAKLIRDPAYVYKGMIYCDGIIDQSAQIIPKQTDNGTHNARCQFKKCLFRVEVLDSFTKIIKVREAQAEYDLLLKQREVLMDSIDKEVLNDHDLLLAQKRRDLDLLKIEANSEDQDNKLVQKKNFGAKIQYGQPILLKHVFSNKYLQVKPRQMALQQGQIQVGLGELSSLSLLKLVPCQDIGNIAAEMLINSKMTNKFNLKVGGRVNLQDAFYLMNTEAGQNYFLSVNVQDAMSQTGREVSLELSAGFMPSKFQSKLFIDAFSHFDAIIDSYQDKAGKQKISNKQAQSHDDQIIYSGDTVRLLHQESGVFLASQQRNLGDRSLMPPYPDFLNMQIKKLAEEAERYTETEDDLEDENQQHIAELEQIYFNQTLAGEQFFSQSRYKIVLDRDPRSGYFTDSCWEVQKVKMHKGGMVCLNGVYRFKHIATDKYLSLDDSRFSLELRDDALFSVNSLFCFRSLNQEQEQALDDYGDEVEGKPISDKTQVYIESYFKTYIQIYEDIDDDITTSFHYKDTYNHGYYTALNASKSQLDPVLGVKQNKFDLNEPKMIFQINYVPPQEAMIVFQCNRFFLAIFNFFSFLNNWAVSQTVGYSNLEAAKQEDALEQQSRFIGNVIATISEMLEGAKRLNVKHYHELQQRLVEQRILEQLGYLLELIYYKTMPEVYREKAFKPDRFRKNQGSQKVLDRGQDEHLAYQIAREYLDSINFSVVKLMYLIVHNNQEACSRLSRFSDILMIQYIREDKKMVCKLIRHVYKTADYYFFDRASVIHTDQGLCQRLPTQFTITHQIQKWMQKIESVMFIDETNQNIEAQIFYLQVLTSFCKTQKGWERPSVPNQILVINNMINLESKIPLWFGYERQDEKVFLPFVYFPRLQNESVNNFLDNNPNLSDCYSSNVNQEGAKNFDIIFDLHQITLKCEEDQKSWLPYMRYIAAVIDFYTALCAGRNFAAITAMREKLGFTNQFIKSIIMESHGLEQSFHQILKDSVFRLCKTLIVDYQPYASWIESQPINVFMWQSLADFQPYQTVYRWEKSKYGEQKGGGSGISEAECESIMTLLRQHGTSYIQAESNELREFLYSYEGKKYDPVQVNQYMQQLIKNLDAIHALLQSENGDAILTAALLSLSYQLLAGFASVEQIYDLQDRWIYKLQRAANKLDKCRAKVQKLVTKALTILQTISFQRRSKQLFKFVQVFRDFQEGHGMDYINYDQVTMYRKFKAIFSIDQFQSSYDIKLLQKYMLMLNQELPIILDQAQENTQMEESAKAEKEAAIKLMEEDLAKKLAVFGGIKFGAQEQTEGEEKEGEAENQSQESQLLVKAQEEAEVQVIQVSDKKASNKQYSLYTQSVPIDEYLVYFTFQQTAYNLIPDQSLAILNDTVNQRQQLLHSAVQVELCVSKDDVSTFTEIKELRERLYFLSQKIKNEEELFILARLGKNEDSKTLVNDLRMIVNRLRMHLEKRSDAIEMQKCQNMMRNVHLVDLLLDKLFKGLYYDRVIHRMMFQDVLDFLFYYSLNNPLNQNSLRRHVAYLLELTLRELNCARILAQVIKQDRQSTYCQKFIQYVCQRITKENYYKSQIFRMLSVLAKDSPNMQVFILAQLIGQLTFKNKLYMTPLTSSMKVDRIKELSRKMILFGAQSQIDRLAFQDNMELDFERINLHLAIVEFVSVCCDQNYYAIKQLRLVVDQECLLDSIMATSIPYKLKPHYLQLFYRVYIKKLKEIDNLDVNNPRVLDLVKSVILLDIENYYQFYTGLLTKITEDMEPEFVENSGKVKLDLEKQSQDMATRIQGKKSYKQKQEEKEALHVLSALNGNRTFPFIELNNYSEYWEYLVSYDLELQENKGLLIFISDFYTTISDRIDYWSEELKQVSIKLRDKLFELQEKLDDIQQTYLATITDLDLIFFAIDQAIMAIPNLNVYARANPKQRQIMIANPFFLFEEYEDMGVETIDKLVRLIRDAIIAKTNNLREMFEIKSLAIDIQMQPYFMKRKLKDIVGNDATFIEIEWFVRKLIALTEQKINYRTVQGTEVGQPGYTRSRYLRFAMQAKQLGAHEVLFNFREFEQMIKSSLTKAGYKPPAILRERTIKEDILVMNMAEKDLSLSCQADLQLFIKNYIEFMDKYKDATELDDLALKILEKFNYAFLEGSKKVDPSNIIDSIEFRSFRVIKLFLRKMMKNVHNRKHQPIQTQEQIRGKTFLLRLLSAMLKQLNPIKVEVQVRHIASQRLKILQNIMIDCGILRQAVGLVDYNEDMEVIDESLTLIYWLTYNFNTNSIKQLLVTLTNTKDDFCYSFFKVISSKVNDAVLILKRQLLMSQGDYDSLTSRDPAKERIVNELTIDKAMASEPDHFYPTTNLLGQPFFPPKENLEIRLLQRDNSKVEQLLTIVDFLTQVCYVDINENPPLIKLEGCEDEIGFGQSQMQHLLHEQSILHTKDINLVQCIGQTLISIVEVAQSLGGQKQSLFENPSLVDLVEKILKALSTFAKAEFARTQKFYSDWNQLQRALNFFVLQDFGFLLVDSEIQRNKIKLLNCTLKLIKSTVMNPDTSVQQQVAAEIRKHLSFEGLRHRLIDIFKFKIGGTPHREKIYRSQRICDHWNSPLHGVFTNAICSRDEFCFFEHLVPYDRVTIECAQLAFELIFTFNLALPAFALGSVKFDQQETSWFYNEYYPRFKTRYEFEAFERISESALALVNATHSQGGSSEIDSDKFLDEAAFNNEVNAMLYLLFVKFATQKYQTTSFVPDQMDVLQQEQSFIVEGIDDPNRIIMSEQKGQKNLSHDNPCFNEDETRAEWEEIFVDLIHKRKQISTLNRMCCQKPETTKTDGTRRSGLEIALEQTVRTIFCCMCLNKFVKQLSLNQLQRARNLIKQKAALDDIEERQKISNYFKQRSLQIQRSRDFVGQMTGSFSKQILQSQAYIFDQFKFECTYRFFLESHQSVEIVLNDGTFRKEYFLAPVYCNYLSPVIKQRILDMQLDLFDTKADDERTDVRLKALISRISDLKADMQLHQKIEQVPLLMKLASYWRQAQFSAFISVLLVNFLILLTTKSVNKKIESNYLSYVLSYDIMSQQDAQLTLTRSFASYVNPIIERTQMGTVINLFFATAGYQLQNFHALYLESTNGDFTAPLPKVLTNNLEGLGMENVPTRALASQMGVIIRTRSWIQKVAIHFGLLFMAPLMRQEQAFNWVQLFLAIASLQNQQYLLVLLVVQISFYVPFLRSVGRAVFNSLSKIASVILLYAVFIYVFAYLVFFTMPKYQFNNLSAFQDIDRLNTENVTFAHYLLHNETADKRKELLTYIKYLNETDFTKITAIKENFTLPPLDPRPIKAYTMWSIVQNYAEFQLFQGYNSILNFCKIITFYGISNLSLSQAFTMAMQQKEDSSPLKELLSASSDEMGQAQRLTYDWNDTVIDFAFVIVTVCLFGYLMVSVSVNLIFELKKQTQRRQRHKQHTCFICGQTEDQILKGETGAQSWKVHIQKDHNVFSYINYILYVQQKVIDEYSWSQKNTTFNTSYFLTSVEQYVLEKAEKGDVSFIPRHTSMKKTTKS